MIPRAELSGIFNGIPPSRKAAQVTLKAFELGMDPTFYTQQAGTLAQEDQRGKAGMFGKAKDPLDELDLIVSSYEQQLPTYRTRSAQHGPNHIIFKPSESDIVGVTDNQQTINKVSLDLDGDAMFAKIPGEGATIFCALPASS